MMKRLLVALDGSSHSDKALELAADLAETYGAELLLVHVLSSAPLSDSERQMAAAEYMEELGAWATARPQTGNGEPAEGETQETGRQLLIHYDELTRHFRETMGRSLMASAKKRLARRKTLSTQILLADGDPAETIASLAKERRADVIVIGSRGLSDFKGLFLGSVSHKVSHLAECTCVTVK